VSPGAPEPVPAPAPTRIGRRLFVWGSRTFVMGIVNVTPDSFSGDGLLRGELDHGELDAVEAAVGQARAMIADGADLLDIGGESTRPGHAPVDAAEELRRVVPVITAVRAALPDAPISVDTTKRDVAAAALDAGADLINDVWGAAPTNAQLRLAAERRVPIVLMHNRTEPVYADVIPEVLADLRSAVDRALDAGVAEDSIIVDPGFGFGKTPEHNLALLRHLADFRSLGRPVLLGTSRKSTLGRVLDLPPEERLEATIATTALAAAAGVDIVRVHDVRPNARAARMVDAIWRTAPSAEPAGPGGQT
jgi:dihydropteroate synthase